MPLDETFTDFFRVLSWLEYNDVLIDMDTDGSYVFYLSGTQYSRYASLVSLFRSVFSSIVSNY